MDKDIGLKQRSNFFLLLLGPIPDLTLNSLFKRTAPSIWFTHRKKIRNEPLGYMFYGCKFMYSLNSNLTFSMLLVKAL